MEALLKFQNFLADESLPIERVFQNSIIEIRIEVENMGSFVWVLSAEWDEKVEKF